MIYSIAILSISLSLDAFGVGLSYGIKKTKVPFVSKGIICLLSIIYAAVALVFGKWLYTFIPPSISKWIGVLILGIMGLWMLVQAILKKGDDEITTAQNTFTQSQTQKRVTSLKIALKSLEITIKIIRNPSKGDIDHSGVIDTYESLLLGLALSVDSIGVGIGTALTGFYSSVTPFTIGICQFIFLGSGLMIGKKIANHIKFGQKYIALLPGILLISLAILRLL